MEPITLNQNFDWIFKGKQLLHFKYPPTLNLEEIEVFKDDLPEISDAKLKECFSRSEWLNFVGDIYNEIYKQHQDTSEWTKEVILAFRATDVDLELHYINKWIKYWYLLKKFSLPNENPNFENWTLVVEKARSIPIESLYTGQLRHSGNRLMGLCPFHQEKTPSFVIFETNRAKCFGCSWFGDAINFYQELKGIGFTESVRELNV